MKEEKIKITVEYTDLYGDRKSVESEYPAIRKELLGNVLSVIGKFNEADKSYGFIFLKGEPHEEILGVLQPTVYARVSPKLPQAEDFKRMLVRKIGSIWKEHMKWASAGNNVSYVPSAEIEKEESITDYIAKGKF